MIITEFTIDHPVCREPLRRVLDLELTWEQTFDRLAGPTQMTLWVDSPDFDAFDAAMAADPTTSNPTRLAEVGGRRLYRVDFTEKGRVTYLMPQIGEVGGLLQRAVGTNDGWRCRVRFPDREGLQQIYEFCREHDIDFEVHRVYERAEWPGGDGPRLTDAQLELLIEAIDSGFLEIPRRSTLGGLAERLGISKTAASERFRRGVRALVEQTIYRAPGERDV